MFKVLACFLIFEQHVNCNFDIAGVENYNLLYLYSLNIFLLLRYFKNYNLLFNHNFDTKYNNPI